MSNRRDFLKNISLFAAGGLLAGKAGSVNAANAALGVVDEVHAGKGDWLADLFFIPRII